MESTSCDVILQVNRQVTVTEERKKKQIADCKKIASARAEVQQEVDILRKELQHIVIPQ